MRQPSNRSRYQDSRRRVPQPPARIPIGLRCAPVRQDHGLEAIAERQRPQGVRDDGYSIAQILRAACDNPTRDASRPTPGVAPARRYRADSRYSSGLLGFLGLTKHTRPHVI